MPTGSSCVRTAGQSASMPAASAVTRRCSTRGTTCRCWPASRARCATGAPFKDWVLPPGLERVRRKLAGSADGDRQMVGILTTVLSDGLPAVEAACQQALRDGVHSADVVINILARSREAVPTVTIMTPEALQLAARAGRRLHPIRQPQEGRVMERSEILAAMGDLKLYGMKAAFDEIITTAIKRQHEPARIVGDLLAAEISEKQARSIRYQITIARLPLAKDVADFQFVSTPINETLVRDLASGNFLARRRRTRGLTCLVPTRPSSCWSLRPRRCSAGSRHRRHPVPTTTRSRPSSREPTSPRIGR